MVYLKTKNDKHENDNEKRRRSIKEKAKAKFSQSEIIKQALSHSRSGNSLNKKVVFGLGDHDSETGRGGDDSYKSNGNGKPVLFDSSDSENENFEIKEKTQFSGKKGFELLNLQSTYGNDERFKIDERFLEEEETDDVNGAKNETNLDETTLGEKTRQLKILESVLGAPIVNPEKEKKKKRVFEMIRYDVSNKDHEIYEKNIPGDTENFTKKGKGRKKIRTDQEGLPAPVVSKDKFYEVSSEIKNRFKEDQDEGGQFSLLRTYGLNSSGKVEENHEEKMVNKKLESNFGKQVNQEGPKTGIEFEKALQEEEEILEKKSKVQEKSTTAKGIWKESFFFDEDDERFKESLEFINKKKSSEATEAAENFGKTRKILREILRLHLKKQMHKKDPFKNKIGGMNKKQLANSRFKNPKMLLNKRKIAKRNSERTT